MSLSRLTLIVKLFVTKYVLPSTTFPVAMINLTEETGICFQIAQAMFWWVTGDGNIACELYEDYVDELL